MEAKNKQEKAALMFMDEQQTYYRGIYVKPGKSTYIIYNTSIMYSPSEKVLSILSKVTCGIFTKYTCACNN